MSFLLGKTGMYLGLAVVGLIALAVISRNWSCRQQPGPMEERLGPYEVAEVRTGATLTVKAGPLGRKSKTVTLLGIAAPADGQPYFAESRDHLAASAGATVTLLVKKDRRFERPDLAGECFGESGINLQLEQLRAGWATCEADAPKDYLAAQAAAKKSRRGIWQ